MKKRNTYKKYLHYEEADFLGDPSFQDWAFSPTPENEFLWKQVAEAMPEKKASMESALLFLRSIRIKEHIPNEEQVNAAFAKHIASLKDAGLLDIVGPAEFKRPLWYYVRNIAALLAGVLLLFSAYLFFQKRDVQEDKVVHTNFGETRQLALPDGSHVQLNSNSSIRYHADWRKGKVREIWLEGEAIFNVVHLNQDTTRLQPEEYFVVHTKGLNVTVLGTTFDIRQRREVTEVVLQKGKIKVSFPSRTMPEVVLTPGKRLVFHGQTKTLLEDAVETENYTAWQQKRLILINPTLKEITQYLEDNFGKKIIVSNKSLNSKMIAGPIPLNSLNDALFVISTVSNVEVVRADSSTIILRQRQAP